MNYTTMHGVSCLFLFFFVFFIFLFLFFCFFIVLFFFFNDTATTEIYTLSLHDALPISITPDSRAHYYAKPGVGNLTARDHMVSTTPYGRTGQYFNTIFFDVCSIDNGTTWSTPWIVDDPAVYYLGGGRNTTAGRGFNNFR